MPTITRRDLIRGIGATIIAGSVPSSPPTSRLEQIQAADQARDKLTIFTKDGKIVLIQTPGYIRTHLCNS